MKDRVYLVPGFFGFANLGELRYFAHVREYLTKACAERGLDVEVHAVRTHPTSSLRRRAARLLETIAATDGAGAIHLVGHSSGGLDARLLASPGVTLAARVDPEPLAAGVRTVVTVAAPHRGTPVAGFFTSLLGQRLLEGLSLSTMYALRFGRVPLRMLLRLGAAFARLDRHLGMNSALLDQLFAQLLADFSPGRRHAIARLLGEVRADQALMVQLSPEGMDVFNALARDRPGVRYGCVVTRARPPGVGSTLAAGLDPSAHASHVVYGALYRLAGADERRVRRPRLAPAQTRALVRAYGKLPSVRANDGVVPTLSQVWGDVIHAAAADHLDVVGHFDDRHHVPPHYDWLATGTGFDRPGFEALWADVAGYLAAGALTTRARSGPSPSGRRPRRPRSP